MDVTADLVKSKLIEKLDTIGVNYVLPPINFPKGVAFLKFEFSLTKKLKNGALNQSNGNMTVFATYCPFCGTKYE